LYTYSSSDFLVSLLHSKTYFGRPLKLALPGAVSSLDLLLAPVHKLSEELHEYTNAEHEDRTVLPLLF